MDAAEAADKHVILINPLLKDIQSSGGVMSVRCGSPSPCLPRPL